MANIQGNKAVDDMVLNAVVSYLSNVSEVKNTITNITKAMISNMPNKERKMFPTHPATVRVILNRITNRLRSRGITIQFSRGSDSMRTRFCILKMR
jgi:hypothetical protein